MELLKVINDYTFQVVALGSFLLGIISGVLGSFSVLRKQSLIGDAISHCALPGIAVAFLVTNIKNTEVLLLGAFISGVLGILLINSIVKYTKIKYDASLAFTLSVFFGLGVVLLTYIQKVSGSNQAGLEKFIYGQASTLLRRDIYLMIIVGTILLTLLIVFWKQFKVMTFDRDFATSIGIRTNLINVLLSVMLVLAIIIGLQSVGVILMSAMLIAPAVCARQWTNNLVKMVIISGFVGGVSGVSGTLISSTYRNIPTGPTIVIIMSTIVLVSLIFAPKRGLISKLIKQRKNREDILKGKYQFLDGDEV